MVVTGKLYSRNYEQEGQRRTAVTVEAQNVAADLSRCTVVLKRDRRPATEVGATGDQKPDTQDDANWPAALVGAAPGDES